MREIRYLNDMLGLDKPVRLGEVRQVEDAMADVLVSRGVAEYADGLTERGARVSPRVLSQDAAAVEVMAAAGERSAAAVPPSPAGSLRQSKKAKTR